MISNFQEYGWLVYCYDDEDILFVQCVYKTEDDARWFLRETPYFYISSDINECIKFKIKKIEIK